MAYQEHINNTDRRSIVALFIETQPEQKYINAAFHHTVMAQNVPVAEAILEHAEISGDTKNMFRDHFTYRGLLVYLAAVAGALFPSSNQAEKLLDEQEKYTWMFTQLNERRSTREHSLNNTD